MQFNHRLLATVTLLAALGTAAWGLASGVTGGLRWSLAALAAAVLGQYVLGVATLLWVVPVSLGTAHQGMAVLVLTAALVATHMLRRPVAEPVLKR